MALFARRVSISTARIPLCCESATTVKVTDRVRGGKHRNCNRYPWVMVETTQGSAPIVSQDVLCSRRRDKRGQGPSNCQERGGGARGPRPRPALPRRAVSSWTLRSSGAPCIGWGGAWPEAQPEAPQRLPVYCGCFGGPPTSPEHTSGHLGSPRAL